MKYVAKIFTAAIFSASFVSNAAITRSDIEWATVIGWDLAGELRACDKYDGGQNYFSSAADVEVAILKLVRRSKIVGDDFPEIQASKIALMQQVNGSGLAGKAMIESKDAVIASCRTKLKEAKLFVKRAVKISSDDVDTTPAPRVRKKMPMVPNVCAAMARGEGYSMDCDNALRQQINKIDD